MSAIAANPPLSTASDTRVITIAILAMGGEGGGVLADWIVDLAEQSGFLAQTTSVPGVAQRTGTTIYYIELFPEAAAISAGKEPVLALMPVPGEVDLVIASELMEAARAVQRGLVTPDRTTLITSTNRVYSMTEKTAVADGRVDPEKLFNSAQAGAKVFIHEDFAKIASENHSLISAALFGALAGTNAVPFSREQFEQAIHRSGVSVQSSLAAFSAGLQAVSTPQQEAPPPALTNNVGWRLRGLAARIGADFPAAAQDILLAGVQRLADYQDVAYASEYLDILAPVRRADTHSSAEIMREAARYLALWMSYEDAGRVADLKIRRTRFERVRGESRAAGAQLVHINEFLYPRTEEIADVLPVTLGRWLMKTKWVQNLIDRLARNGQIVQTTSVRGFLKLYLMAELRGVRRRSLRFQREHNQIRAWLAMLPTLAAEDYALAAEVAEWPGLLKGYGDTHARGEKNYEILMAALARLRGSTHATQQLRALREAALADDSGEKLSAALKLVAA